MRAVEFLDLVHPADDRNAVRVVDEERRRHRLGQLRSRIGLDTHPALLENDVPLGRDDGIVEEQVRHPIGLEVHHRAEMLARDALEIGGVVERGEGVLLAAEAGDDLRELARRDASRCP